MGFYSVISANKEKNLGAFCFCILSAFFRISRSWGISRFANLPFVICLGEKGLMKSYKRKQI